MKRRSTQLMNEDEIVPMEHLYAQLHMNAALSRRCDYSQACKELACILRKLYARAPKGVQLALYRDVVSAFRLLPEMDTFQQLSAAEVLLQAVEATFPKKRRIAAVSEYKQAAVAQNRRAKHQEGEKPADYVHLSTDLLLQIFGFLDPRSLAISSAVCRIWNEAANDDGLWCTQFLSMFDGPNFERESMSLSLMFRSSKGSYQKPSSFGANGERHGFWRKALAWKLSRPGHLERLSISNRVLCMGCKTLYWLSESPEIQNKRKNCKHQQYTARPVPLGKVLDFILSELSSSSSSSSGDSDTDEDFRPRYSLRSWAYPKLEQSHLRSSASSVQQLYTLSLSLKSLQTRKSMRNFT